VVIDRLGLPQHAFLREAEPFGNSTTLGITGGAPDLDAVELEFKK
jgi:hypothetical protein